MHISQNNLKEDKFNSSPLLTLCIKWVQQSNIKVFVIKTPALLPKYRNTLFQIFIVVIGTKPIFKTSRVSYLSSKKIIRSIGGYIYIYNPCTFRSNCTINKNKTNDVYEYFVFGASVSTLISNNCRVLRFSEFYACSSRTKFCGNFKNVQKPSPRFNARVRPNLIVVLRDDITLRDVFVL